MLLDATKIRELLAQVKDPELPEINIVELGIVREISVNDKEVSISITPTYLGCPALDIIQDEIKSVMTSAGFSQISINVVLSPPWSTDCLSDETKKKFKSCGISPPNNEAADRLVMLAKGIRPATCPFCGSKNTENKAEFGSTACKSLYHCHQCNLPFEHFKSI